MSFIALIVTALGNVATLLALHIGLWRYRSNIPLLARYVVGVGVLGFWFSAWALWEGLTLVVLLAWWFIVGTGGAAIIVAHWVRGVTGEADQAAYTAGLLGGKAVRGQTDKGE